MCTFKQRNQSASECEISSYFKLHLIFVVGKLPGFLLHISHFPSYTITVSSTYVM